MHYFAESWSAVVILASAFIIGWGAESAQTFMSRALALSLLAWLQTLPEFAVEAHIAWNRQTELMIANLTGSLRLLVGLGWPMIFFVQYFSQVRKKTAETSVHLEPSDFLGVLFLFVSILYFGVILAKASLSLWDAAVLIVIYSIYLVLSARMPVGHSEGAEDLPWVARKIVSYQGNTRLFLTISLFVIGGIGLYVSVEPFVETLKGWSVAWGISTFVFVQWVAPFLSEFPEYVTTFNWSRQPRKAPMALMNIVSSNINQWTMLAAMIPIVYGLSLGHPEPILLDPMHQMELGLTIAQSFLGGLLLLDLSFSILDASLILVLWLVQFIEAPLREPVLIAYCIWIAVELLKIVLGFLTRRELPKAFTLARRYFRGEAW